MSSQNRSVERVQTGVRIEKRILKVLKAVASHHEMSLGGLLEGIVLHNFEGKLPFSQDTLDFVEAMKKAYHLDLTAADSHKMDDDSV